VWGLAFKPYTDDIREAPSIANIDLLLDAGAKINAYDPEAMENVKSIYGDRINFCRDEYEALEEADALLVVTEWPVFRTPEFETMSQKMKNNLIFDGRNLYETGMMKEKGFTYFSIGRKEVND